MTQKVIIAGSGGQGIILLGKVLAEAALWDKKDVTCFPAYGAEVRGGSAYCMVTISDAEIGSPYVEKADALILMNELSYLKFKERLKNPGLCLINGSLVGQAIKNSRLRLKFPFTEIAIKLGNPKVANMVALGCLLAHKEMVKIASVIKVIEKIAPPDKRGLIEINKQALLRGVALR